MARASISSPHCQTRWLSGVSSTRWGPIAEARKPNQLASAGSPVNRSSESSRPSSEKAGVFGRSQPALAFLKYVRCAWKRETGSTEASSGLHVRCGSRFAARFRTAAENQKDSARILLRMVRSAGGSGRAPAPGTTSTRKCSSRICTVVPRPDRSDGRPREREPRWTNRSSRDARTPSS